MTLLPVQRGRHRCTLDKTGTWERKIEWGEGSVHPASEKVARKAFKKRPLWCLLEHFWDLEANLVPLAACSPFKSNGYIKENTFQVTQHIWLAVRCYVNHGASLFHVSSLVRICIFSVVAFRSLCRKALQHVDGMCSDLINNIGVRGTLGMQTALAGDTEGITRETSCDWGGVQRKCVASGQGLASEPTGELTIRRDKKSKHTRNLLGLNPNY